MRKIFYIPEGHKPDDYINDWEGQTNEVHTGLSENIKNYVKEPDRAGFIHVPEFKHMLAPLNESSSNYFQIAYVNDFAAVDILNNEEPPMYVLEVWTKNLDNPNEQQEKLTSHPMQFDVGAMFFHTDHFKLDVGWYDLIVVEEYNGEELDSHEITIYEGTEEEE